MLDDMYSSTSNRCFIVAAAAGLPNDNRSWGLGWLMRMQQQA
jgi:hypothetical protein